LEQFYRLPEVTRFLIGYEGFVALQFPDSMLSDATRIVEKLESECVGCQFCIVGDSTYGEGDVDEVNARHLDNQRIVLFGDANCKQKTTIKSLFIRVNPFSADKFKKSINSIMEKEGADQVLLLSENEALLNELNDLEIEKQILTLDEATGQTERKVIYLGKGDNPKLVAWAMQNQPEELFVIAPESGEIERNPVNFGRLLMQRFHLIERGKDAERVGLLVGSNGAHDLTLECIDKLRSLAIRAGKTAYTIVVGEPTPQKLANFAEMDVFVLIGSPELSILPAKGFFKPVLHPWEFMMACSGREWDGNFCANWTRFLQDKIDIQLKENDISLITGQIRTVEISSDVVDDSSDGQLSVIGKRDVARIESQPLRNGKEFFGLTQESAATFSVISDGTTGIAAQYNYEK